MGHIKRVLKKIPGIMFAVKKARGFLQYYEYKKALSRIKSTKQKVAERHANEPNEKIVVAFIIQYTPSWNKLKPVYDKLNEDRKFEVLLLCVPSLLNEKRTVNCSKNEVKNDTFEYFENQGYECIDAWNNGKWFNLEKCKPDFVFHSRPYNQFMPTQYNSSVISQYALLCNVMYAASLAQNFEEATLNFDYYKDVFCYFAFAKFEAEFYKERFNYGIGQGVQKCYLYGATGLEQMLLAETMKKKNAFKKTVIWTPRWSTDPHIGGSNFFRYKDTIESLVEKYPDVMFIIRPHPLMFGNFITTGEMTEKEVDEFKNYCNKTFNVRLDEEKEYVDTFWQSDFLISDVSGIVPEYYVTNKPVIYCNSKADFIYSDYALELFKHSYVINDSEELIKAFELLYNENDYKIADRKKSFFTIFGDIENASKSIVNILYNTIK